MPDRFNAFTERARTVLRLAQEEAQRFNHNYIGTEHLLLALTWEGGGIAACILEARGGDLVTVRDRVLAIIHPAPAEPLVRRLSRYTQRGRTVLRLAQEESQGLGQAQVGTEHLLLGLIREADGVAGRVLLGLGLTPERVREAARQVTGEEHPSEGRGELTLEAGRALDAAEAAARERHDRFVGTEHLLLGLLAEPAGRAGALLRAPGHDLLRVRERVDEALAQPPGPAPRAGSTPGAGASASTSSPSGRGGPCRRPRRSRPASGTAPLGPSISCSGCCAIPECRHAGFGRARPGCRRGAAGAGTHAPAWRSAAGRSVRPRTHSQAGDRTGGPGGARVAPRLPRGGAPAAGRAARGREPGRRGARCTWRHVRAGARRGGARAEPGGSPPARRAHPSRPAVGSPRAPGTAPARARTAEELEALFGDLRAFLAHPTHRPAEAGLFARLSNEALRALALARQEAQRFNHTSLGTTHLPLGLVRDQQAVAGRVLLSLGVQLNKVRSTVESIIGHGDRPVAGEIGLTPRAKKVIELAVGEAEQLGDQAVGSEHLLLGLVREGEGIGAGILESLGIGPDQVRSAVVAGLATPGTVRLPAPLRAEPLTQRARGAIEQGAAGRPLVLPSRGRPRSMTRRSHSTVREGHPSAAHPPVITHVVPLPLVSTTHGRQWT